MPKINIDELTIKQVREIQALTSCIDKQAPTTTATQDGSRGLNAMIGEKVIIRTYSAGVWFGVLDQKSGKEVIVTDARRMYRWWAKNGISLSGVALYGVEHSKSKIIEPVDSVWLEAIEIIPCATNAAASLESAAPVAAE